MKRALIFFFLLFALGSCGSFAADQNALENPFPEGMSQHNAFEKLPVEVKKLVIDAEVCLQMGNELDENTPPEQRKEFEATINECCPRAHTNYLLLSKKYQHDKAVSNFLKPYYDSLVKDYTP
jgi:hypothetical protein